MTDSAPVKPPDATYIRQRWISTKRCDWAADCDRILTEYGRVDGTVAYEHRYQARWRAQSLIRLLVALNMHPRWQLSEHTERRQGGWIWSVEYKGRDGNG